MLKKIALFALVFLIVGGIIFLLGPRVPVDQQLRPNKVPTKPDQLEAFIKQQEGRFKDIRPNTEKQIIWANEAKTQTPLSVIYLHGWSATRQETAPLGPKLAKALGANFFATRLTGHGRTGEALAKATINDWLNDTMEALRIGKTLGKRVIVLGTSTGGTLATWLATHVASPEVIAFVMISPNFAPKDKRSKILLWPWGAQIAHALIGKKRSWKPVNAAQGKYWTTSYPTTALLPMMGLVELIGKAHLRDFRTPVLMMYSKQDDVIDPQLIEQRFPHIGAKVKKLIAVKTKGDRHHVFVGDVLAPERTTPILKEIMDFLKPLVPKPAAPTARTPTTPRTKPTEPPGSPAPTKTPQNRKP